MKAQLWNSAISRKLTTIAFVALVFNASAGYAASSSATSRVGITKLDLLQVSSIEQTELVLSSRVDLMQTDACLQSAGIDMPYRISASSLYGKSQFFVKGNESVIPYQVSWSNESDRRTVWVLESAKDQTGVVSASAGSKCALSTVSVQLNNRVFKNVSDDVYIDTLTLILVIE